MKTERTLITQMLEALESAAPDVANTHYGQLWDAINAAREYLSKDSQESEALVAPEANQEPVAWMHHIKEPNQDWYSLLSHHSAPPWKFTQSYLDRCEYKGVPLYLHPATSVQIESVEPVLWVNSEEDVEFSLKPWMSSEAWKPLYTHPAPKAEQAPQPVELTDADVAAALATWFSKEFEYNSSMETRMRAAVMAAQGVKK